MAYLIGLLPSSVRLDGYAPKVEPVATYVRLEYGAGGADWFLAEARRRPPRAHTRAERPQGAWRDRIRGIVEHVVSLFQLVRGSEDAPAAEPGHGGEGRDAPRPEP